MTDIRVIPGDAASLERAVAAAPQGSILHVPPGDYAVSKTLDVRHLNAIIFDQPGAIERPGFRPMTSDEAPAFRPLLALDPHGDRD